MKGEYNGSESAVFTYDYFVFFCLHVWLFWERGKYHWFSRSVGGMGDGSGWR